MKKIESSQKTTIKGTRKLHWWLLSSALFTLNTQAAISEDTGLKQIDSVLKNVGDDTLDSLELLSLSLQKDSDMAMLINNDEFNIDLADNINANDEELALVESDSSETPSRLYNVSQTKDADDSDNHESHSSAVYIEMILGAVAAAFLVFYYVNKKHDNNPEPESDKTACDASDTTGLTLWAGYPDNTFSKDFYSTLLSKVVNFNKEHDSYTSDQNENHCIQIDNVIGYVSSPWLEGKEEGNEYYDIFTPDNFVKIINNFNEKDIKLDVHIDYASFNCEGSPCVFYKSNETDNKPGIVNELNDKYWNTNDNKVHADSFKYDSSLHSALRWFSDIANHSDLKYIPKLIFDTLTDESTMHPKSVQQLIYYVDEFRNNYSYDEGDGAYFKTGITVGHNTIKQTYVNVTQYPISEQDKVNFTYLYNKVYKNALESQQENTLVNEEGKVSYHREEDTPLVDAVYFQMYDTSFNYWMTPLQTGLDIDCGESHECLNKALQQIPIDKSSSGLTYKKTNEHNQHLYTVTDNNDFNAISIGARITAEMGETSYSVVDKNEANKTITLSSDPFENLDHFYYEQSPTKYTYPPLIDDNDVKNIYMMFSFESLPPGPFFIDPTNDKKPLPPGEFVEFLDDFVAYTNSDNEFYRTHSSDETERPTDPVKLPNDNFAVFAYQWLHDDDNWFGS